MKPRFSWLLAGICAFCSGCEILEFATCNLAYEAWLEKEHAVACVRSRQLAEQAWRESLCSNSGQVHSVDYDRGFKDGHAGYLEANGCLLTPVLPPKHYWSARFQTPEGHRAIEDWYLGYQHGAQAARASGLREFITVPTPGHTAAPAVPPPGEPVPEATSFSDGLPMPRPASVFPMTVPPATGVRSQGTGVRDQESG